MRAGAAGLRIGERVRYFPNGAILLKSFRWRRFVPVPRLGRRGSGPATPPRHFRMKSAMPT